MRLYENLLRPLFFQLDAEKAHELVMKGLRLGSHMPPLIRLLVGASPSSASTARQVATIKFPNPIGLAAGMDKNGLALPAWEALGFGFIEVGTITAHAQPGNPRPRLFRYPAEQALINRLGFNNDGVEVIARRLMKLRESGRWPRIPVGLNLGKSRVTAVENAADDYLTSFQRLRGLGDYFVINVSSPNTPGLRDLQAKEALSVIIKKLRDWEGTPRQPLFVKVAPDLAEEDLIAVVELAEQEQLSGLIATNTTLDHSAILQGQRSQGGHGKDQTGGLSGVPLRQRSLKALEIIRRHTRLPVIACGGISGADSASERFAAGADLLQIYTSFIYQGPRIIRTLSAAAGSAASSL